MRLDADGRESSRTQQGKQVRHTHCTMPIFEARAEGVPGPVREQHLFYLDPAHLQHPTEMPFDVAASPRSVLGKQEA